MWSGLKVCMCISNCCQQAASRVGGNERCMAPFRVGSSRRLRVGQSVFAIGSPFGYGKSLSTGASGDLPRLLPRQLPRAALPADHPTALVIPDQKHKHNVSSKSVVASAGFTQACSCEAHG